MRLLWASVWKKIVTDKRIRDRIAILRTTPLLDPVWYRRVYPNRRNPIIDVARDYLLHGAAEGRNPSRLFDTKFYLDGNPDVVASGENPLVHFLLHGEKEGRDPHPLFDTRFYLEQNPDVAASGQNSTVHYILHGAQEGRVPHPLFDPKFYLNQNPGVAASGENPLVHYILHGGKQGRDPHPLFDAKFYLKQNPEVAALGKNPLEHYLLRGAKEGRDPHALFDTNWYIEHNPDVVAGGFNPLAHYLMYGGREGRDPNPYFDSDWYLAQDADISLFGTNPLVHYVRIGMSAGASPSPLFDPNWYLKRYPEVERAGVAPLFHFLQRGRQQGWEPTADCRRGECAAVTAAEITCLHTPSPSAEVALFVTHSHTGKLTPRVQLYLASLRRHKIAVILIIAADAPVSEIDENLLYKTDGIFVRRNAGCDFAAWSHVLQLHPELFDAEILYLLNDRAAEFGGDNEFKEILKAIHESHADIISLTERYDDNRPLDCSFLALKLGALSSVSFHNFINSINSYTNEAISFNEHQLRLAQTLNEARLTCETIFYSNRSKQKVRDPLEGIDIPNCRKHVAKQGSEVVRSEMITADSSTRRSSQALLFPSVSIASVSSPIKVAFIGPWNYSNGLGVASRGYVSALRRTDFLLNYCPIRRPFHYHRQIAPAFDICDFSGDADIAVVHLNPDGWAGLLTEPQREIIRKAKKSVGLWVWETTQIPDNWFPEFGSVDSIWAPSKYCADAFATKAKVPIHVIPHVVCVDQSPSDTVLAATVREELGISEQERIILYVFDGSSYLVRKNPYALVEAFVKSGLAGSRWKLVLKTKYIHDLPEAGKRLQMLVKASPGVLLIDRSMNKETMDELFRVADIYASPHCSEGFGLTIAEAMALGKIVVATDYGGSRDFLGKDCGFPVDYLLQSLAEDHGHYKRGEVWAQVDVPQLADALVRAARLIVSGDVRIGAAARERIENTLSLEAIATHIRHSISQLT
jgi:glycosyltransferase involved in cell wall biosynthesis